MSRASSATRRTRVLIVDDHPMTRAGLVHVINHQPDMVVCGEAENAAKALASVEAEKPDLVLADITLPGKSGLELIKDIKAMHPRLPTLIISMHDESLMLSASCAPAPADTSPNTRAAKNCCRLFAMF